MSYIFLVIAFLLNSLANVLLKKQSSLEIDTTSGLINTFWGARIGLVGLIAFGLNAVFYFLALKNIKLNVAYPVMVGTTFVLVAIGSKIWFSERFTSVQLLGYALVMLGVLLVVVNSSK
jgi:multidrug transporter EmrE-like cation transporter